MKRAMPYNLEGIISQISSSVVQPKWKSLEEEIPQLVNSKHLQLPNNNKINTKEASSIDSEPLSTLDTTRRSPSSPTSTSTLSSSFTGGRNSGAATDNNAGVVADPACSRKEDWAPELRNVTGGTAEAGGGGGGGIGLEEWDSMFPNGDGSLLPWIMGETDDPGLSLKHLLQGGNPVEYEGNAGLGVVDQGSGLESLSSDVGLVQSGGANLGFTTSGLVNDGKIGSILPNCSSSGVLDCKVGNNGLNPMSCNLIGSLQAAAAGGGGGGGGGVGVGFQQEFSFGDEKPQIFNPQLLINQQQAQSIANPSFVMPPLGYCQLEQHIFQPQAKRHNPGVVLDPGLQVGKSPFLDPGHELLLRKHQHQHQHQLNLQQLPVGLAHPLVTSNHHQKPLMVPKPNHHRPHYPLPNSHHHDHHQQLQEQAVKDHLFKAADLIQTGNFSLAQEILARLNHQLSFPAKPFIRAALYIKEALQMLLLMSSPVAAPPPKTLTPYDIVHKMNAYKAFSEISPINQFVNFTCTQAILEALEDADAVHIIDFDIGCGAQWASLIQELPLRKNGAPSLKITALAPLSTTHPFELALTRENLTQFASDLGVVFELQVMNLDLFDPSSSSLPNFRTSEHESVAVNVPIWSSSNRPSVLPSILRFIKQRSPKIFVSFDRGFDRFDVPFPQHLLHTLESCTNLLESLDGLSVASDIINKIERFFIQPRIENTVIGRVHAPDKMPHWKSLFASAGFLPLQFSNFTETQADYVVKKNLGRGFHVEKRQASLVLSWQRRELVAASAWRCC